MSDKGVSALVWDAARLRVAADAAGIALWSWDVETGEIGMDGRGRTFWNLPITGNLHFADLFARVHPEDIERVKATFAHTREAIGPYEFDFRVLHDEATRWISARGRGGDEGIVGNILFGVFLDVTERRVGEEAHELLAREMSHRVKNLCAVASSLTSIAARSAATTTDMAQDLRQRLASMGRVHELVRPQPGHDGDLSTTLGELLRALLGPYDDRGMTGDRIRVSVPELRVGTATATAIALVVHELATNAVKYGSLSVPSGTLDVSCAGEDGMVTIVWTERGGPPVSALKNPGGFGTTLISQCVTRQLGGSIATDWQSEGVVVTLRMNKARLEA